MARVQFTKPHPLIPGERFGRLVVVERNRERPGSYWWCRCDCGAMRNVWSSHLRSGATTSCGCWGRERLRARTKIKHGQRYGRLFVIDRDAERTVHSLQSYWQCRCDCGELVSVLCSHLLASRIVSCGCYQRDCQTTHGETRGGQTPEYRAWNAIKSRCFNPRNTRYADWGGRGITMAAIYLSDFPAWLAEVGRRPSDHHSIHRIDNDRGYEPGNMKWATRFEQAQNRRRPRKRR